MKKLILTLMAGGLAASSFAHGGGDCFKMGNILLYGVGSYTNQHGSDSYSFASASSSSVDQPRMLNWQVSPGLGFNVTDNLTVGVDFNYNGSKTTYDRKSLGFGSTGSSAYQVDQVKTFNYGIGPFVRYSMPMGEHFFAYGQFEAHYLKGRNSPRYTNSVGSNQFVTDDNYKGLDAAFTPAVGVMVCKSFGITFGIGGVGYDYRKIDYTKTGLPAGSEHTSKVNEFNVSFGQQVNIGVQKYFGCSHKMHHGNMEPMDETRKMDTSDDSTEDNNGDNKGGRKHRRHRKNDDE